MKKGDAFEKKLRQYSVMAVSLLACSTTVQAQVVYTNVEPDLQVDPSTGQYDLDLNNDGTSDFVLKTLFSFGSKWALAKPFPYSSQNQNAIAGFLSGSALPYAFSSGQVIDAGLNWVSNNDLSYNNFPSATYPFASWEILAFYYKDASSSVWKWGNWIGGENRFMALRIQMNDEIHYGWARLDVPVSTFPLIIKDYAYQSIPEQPIIAGDTAGTFTMLQENIKTEAGFLLYPNPGKGLVMIESGLGPALVSIFNSMGENVFERNISSKALVDLIGLPPGIYTIQLRNVKGTSEQKLMID